MHISAEQAQTLLETNFLNICKKLEAGATLTTAETNMLAKHAARAPAPTVAAEMRAAPAALELMPEPAHAAGDGEATATQIAAWSELYATSRRPLYKWISIGRAARDPCPLDHPAQMPLWWATHMKHRVPEKILSAAREAAAHAAPLPPDADSATATLPLPAPTENAHAQPAAALDFASQVAHMRRELSTVQNQLDQARAGKMIDGVVFVDQIAVESLLRQRLAIQEPLRKSEGDLTEWLKQRGLLIPRDEVRAENGRIAMAIVGAVLRLVKAVRPQLSGKTDAEQDRIWQVETLACFAALKTAQFSTLPEESSTAS